MNSQTCGIINNCQQGLSIIHEYSPPISCSYTALFTHVFFIFPQNWYIYIQACKHSYSILVQQIREKSCILW